MSNITEAQILPIISRIKAALAYTNKKDVAVQKYIGAVDAVPLAQYARSIGLSIPGDYRQDTNHPQTGRVGQFPVEPVKRLVEMVEAIMEKRGIAVEPVTPPLRPHFEPVKKSESLLSRTPSFDENTDPITMHDLMDQMKILREENARLRAKSASTSATVSQPSVEDEIFGNVSGPRTAAEKLGIITDGVGPISEQPPEELSVDNVMTDGYEASDQPSSQDTVRLETLNVPQLRKKAKTKGLKIPDETTKSALVEQLRAAEQSVV